MKRFRPGDLSVQTKLWAGFALGFGLLAAIGAISAFQLKTHNEFATDLAGVTLSKVLLLGDMDRGIAQLRLLAQRRVETSDFRQVAAIEEATEVGNAAVATALAEYTAVADGPGEQIPIVRLRQAWTGYQGSLAGLLRALDVGNVGGNLARFEADALRALDSFAEGIGEVVALSKTEAAKTAERAHVLYATFLVLIVATMAVAAAALATGGVWVARSVSLPIRQVGDAMRRLTAGDDTVQIVGNRGRRDEIGALVAAVAGYRTSLVERNRLAAEAETERERFALAVRSMPIGLCLFDAEQRLVISNRRYGEMYGLPESLTRPGAAWADLIRHWAATGNFAGEDPERFFGFLSRINQQSTTSDTVIHLRDGRAHHIIHQPLTGGGWVATHEDVTAQQRAEEQIARLAKEADLERRRLDAAIRDMPIGLSMYGPDRKLIVCNEQYRKLYRLPAELVRQGTPAEKVIAFLVGPEGVIGADAEQFIRQARASIEQGKLFQADQNLADERILSISFQPTADGGWVSTQEDVTVRRRAQQEITRLGRLAEEERQRLDAAVSNMPIGLVMFDKDQRLLVANAKYVEMYALPPDLAVPGTPLSAILDHRASMGSSSSDHGKYDEYLGSMVERRAPFKDTVRLDDGRFISLVFEPIAGGGWVALHEDITDRRKAEDQVAFLARHDALTRLPNRVLFREKLDEMLFALIPERPVALLCIDLDHFKHVNDTLGHPAGDKLLVMVAERLANTVRPGDLVARLGADEFTIVQTGARQPQGARTMAERIIEGLSAPYAVDGRSVSVGISVGVAIGPNDGHDADSLLKCGEMALHRAKSDGRKTFRFFEAEMDARMQARWALEIDLRKGIAEGQFELRYQPQFNLATNAVSGFEALIRWRHPQRGLVPPGEFISAAEENGLIVEIGEWVLKEACAEAMRWSANIKVAVNLSAVQFRGGRLMPAVIAALAASGLPARRLELEITESTLLGENETTLAVLHQLRALGTRVSMDDFGTGYSSLSYLQSFPFDKIKIDQRFVKKINEEKSALAIIRAVIGLSASLGIPTTAEGVETREQFERVKAEGCTEVQGFLTGRPMSAEAAMALLERPGSKASAA